AGHDGAPAAADQQEAQHDRQDQHHEQGRIGEADVETAARPRAAERAEMEGIVDPKLMDRFTRRFSHFASFRSVQSSSAGTAGVPAGTAVALFISFAARTMLSTPAAKPSSSITIRPHGRVGKNMSAR